MIRYQWTVGRLDRQTYQYRPDQDKSPRRKEVIEQVCQMLNIIDPAGFYGAVRVDTPSA